MKVRWANEEGHWTAGDSQDNRREKPEEKPHLPSHGVGKHTCKFTRQPQEMWEPQGAQEVQGTTTAGKH